MGCPCGDRVTHIFWFQTSSQILCMYICIVALSVPLHSAFQLLRAVGRHWTSCDSHWQSSEPRPVYIGLTAIGNPQSLVLCILDVSVVSVVSRRFLFQTGAA